MASLSRSRVCSAAVRLARLADVLGRQVAGDSASEHAVLLAGDGGTSGPPITFHQVPEPKTSRTASTSTSSATPSKPRPSAC